MAWLLRTDQLRGYIEEHLKEDDGSWEYGHTPHLQASVEGFNGADDAALEKIIWDWPEEVRFKMADPILFSNNISVRISCYYLHIFNLTKDLENLEYLAQNLGTCFSSNTMHHWPEETLKTAIQQLAVVNDFLAPLGKDPEYTALIELLKEGIES